MIKSFFAISILTIVFPFLAIARGEPISVRIIKPDQEFAKAHPLVQQFWGDFQASGGIGEIIEVRLSDDMRKELGQFMAVLFEGHFIRVTKSPTRLAPLRQSAFNHEKIVLESLKNIEKQGYPLLGLPPDRISVNAAVIATNKSLPDVEKTISFVLSRIFDKESTDRAFIFSPGANADIMTHEQVHIDQKKAESRMNNFLKDHSGLVDDLQKKWILEKLVQEIDAYSVQLKYLNGLPQSTIFNAVEVDAASTSYSLKKIDHESYLISWLSKTTNALRYSALGLDNYLIKKQGANPTLACRFVDAINEVFPNLHLDYQEILVRSYVKENCIITK